MIKSNGFVYYYIITIIALLLYNNNGHGMSKYAAAERERETETEKEKEKVPAFIVFGDSIMDSGNNNYFAAIGRANYPPYGRDFPGGIPTGRFSNGKVPSDLFAEEIGIKEFLPPYLNPNLQISDLLTGVSFASGGSGYDPNTAKLVNALNLEDQLKLFREYIDKLKAAVGENTTSTIISQSVYLITVGSNDITNNYFLLPTTRLRYNISAYTSLMVARASSFIQELYSLGPRKILLLSTPPLGCVPSQRTLRGGLLRNCAEDENQASILFNNKLISELSSLNKTLHESRIHYIDVYNPLLNLINNPSQSGFEVSKRGCCGTGNIEVAYLCNKLAINTCEDASKYVFWDSFHPTETAYKTIVHEVYLKNFEYFS